jgi:hypothetical protein
MWKNEYMNIWGLFFIFFFFFDNFYSHFHHFLFHMIISNNLHSTVYPFYSCSTYWYYGEYLWSTTILYNIIMNLYSCPTIDFNLQAMDFNHVLFNPHVFNKLGGPMHWMLLRSLRQREQMMRLDCFMQWSPYTSFNNIVWLMFEELVAKKKHKYWYSWQVNNFVFCFVDLVYSLYSCHLMDINKNKHQGS